MNKEELEKEVEMLNKLVELAQPGEWDMLGVYNDIINGTNNGNDLGGEPDEEFGEWYKRRFCLDAVYTE